MLLVEWVTRKLERIDALERRIAALEARPVGVIDGGVWTADKVYARGTGVSHGGGFWVAQCETRREPADGNRDWRLAVHRGKPGRDGRDLRAAS